MSKITKLRGVECGSVQSNGNYQSTYVRQSLLSFGHREFQATAMTVDCTGEWVLLAGRRHLALQRLENSESCAMAESLRKYSTNSKYEISAAEFGICPENKESCAIATSQRIDVVTWGAAEPRYIHSLRGHTRMVTDIDWHGKNSNLLVSCSIDTFSHIWDLRDSRKPSLSFSAVCMSGATQVGFNRVSGNLLAAAHDGDLRIWDIRKGSCPMHYITAHQNRVHGINWSHRRETCLATASQDGTVKYFDVNNPRRAEKIITTLSPVWRARYTPIGNGLVSIVVPHMGRGENSLLLWSNSKQNNPVCSFVGHTDVILDFAWRHNRPGSQREIELVTWSRDRTLRVWKIDDQMLRHCEPDYDDADDDEVNAAFEARDISLQHRQSSCMPTLQKRVTQSATASLPIEALDVLHQIHGGGSALSKASPPLSSSLISRSSSHIHQRASAAAGVARSLTDQQCSLHHEFSLLNTNMPHIEVDVLDAINRFAIFKVSVSSHFVILKVVFPTEYPGPYAGPEFSFCDGTTTNDSTTRAMLKVLKVTAYQRVKKSRTALEHCLRALVTAMKSNDASADKSQLRLQSPRLEGALSGALHNACIPFPRTSTVSFNSIGMLASFAQSLNTKRLTLRHQNLTPRTLSAINGGSFLGNVMGPQPVLYTAHRESNASIYLPDRMTSKHSKNRSIQKTNIPSSTSPLVYVYQCSKLLNFSREMATEYSLKKQSIEDTCRLNRQLCEKLSTARSDLLFVWTIAEMIAKPNIITTNTLKYELLTSDDPFKKYLLELLIIHFAKLGDIQTSVLLACLFHPIVGVAAGNKIISKRAAAAAAVETSNSALVSATSLAIQQAEENNMQISRSDSWSDILLYMDDISRQHTRANVYDVRSLLQRSKLKLFNQFKKCYAEILYGWHLLTVRSLILKHTLDFYSKKSMLQEIDFGTDCSTTSQCTKCKIQSCLGCPNRKASMSCALCCIPVKGLSNTCLACGHGGHLMHMMQWFKAHNICPSGCGCQCLQKTSALLQHMR